MQDLQDIAIKDLMQDLVSLAQKISTGQIETVVGSSLAPVTSLSMQFTGPTDLVVHLGGLTGSAISHL